MQVHRETLEEEATHVTDEARMVLPGVQAVLGFQLIAVFNQRFQELSAGEQLLHLAAFLLMALAMGMVMTPGAYHRQVERGRLGMPLAAYWRLVQDPCSLNEIEVCAAGDVRVQRVNDTSHLDQA